MAVTEERIRPGIHWVEGPTGLGPVIIDERGRQTPVAWAPQPGSQEAFLSCPIFEALFEGTRGGGKLSPLDEPVLTPYGWKPMGDIKVGDMVTSPSGRPVKVTHVFPHKNRAVYRVEFDDGSSTRVGDEHLWKYKIVCGKRKNSDHNWHVNDTMELKRHLEAGRHVLIPTVDPIPMQRHPRLKEWPVEPYLLGLLLGDGHMGSQVGFTNIEPELSELVQTLGFSRKDEKHFTLAQRDDITGILAGLKKLGLRGHRSWNKFIPDLYMKAPVVDRLAILQGLMDTDGTVTKDGSISYSSCSRTLAENVRYLAWSLGAKASMRCKRVFLYGVPKRDAWIVHIQPGDKFEPFRLRRKQERVAGYQHPELCRAVVGIEYVGHMDAQCIALDSLDHLYVTKDFIVTHNTDTLIMDFCQHVGAGWGAEWRGILFRRTYPELEDVISKSKKWFGQIFPHARYNEAKSVWTWPTGETLRFRHFKTADDYWSYHGHCLSNGDVLTDKGWRDIREVQVGDTVLSVDGADNLCWKTVDSKTDEAFEGHLVQHSGRGTFMEFTEGHRLPTPEGHIPYNQLGRHATIRVGGWKLDQEELKTFSVPLVSRPMGRHKDELFPLEILGDDYFELMGWFLAEGYVTQKSDLAWGISQSKSAHRETIEALLNRVGFPYRNHTNGYTMSSRSWRAYLGQFGKCREKFVPEEIFKGSRRQLEIFLRAFADGDGTRQGQGRIYLFTTSKRLSEDLQKIGVLLGYTVYASERTREDREGISYTIALRPRGLMNIRTDNYTRGVAKKTNRCDFMRVPHSGRVYCLGVEGTHCFFVRQNGAVWLSSNSYPWQGWEELTTWPTDECMKSMFSCARSSVKGIPIKIRATTNPYGVGHHWVKQRYRLPLGMNRVVGAVIRDSKDEGGNTEPPRVAIHSNIRENKILLFSDPGYIQRISASARNPSERAAWIYGSWDIVSGGIFQDVFDRSVHILPDILPILPASWRVDRSFDWGSSKPFSVGWWATSDGSELDLPGGKKMRTIAGDVFRVAEWYGWDGKPNKGVYMTAAEIAMGIKERESRLFPRHKVRPGPADSSIFDSEDGHSVASGMSRLGVSWVRADKSAGSRKNGWERIRVLLKNAIPSEDGLPREEAALYITERCDQWIRTVPSLQRDDKDLDDVDTESEDHIGDETRYRLYRGSSRLVKKTINGR